MASFADLMKRGIPKSVDECEELLDAAGIPNLPADLAEKAAALTEAELYGFLFMSIASEIPKFIAILGGLRDRCASCAAVGSPCPLCLADAEVLMKTAVNVAAMTRLANRAMRPDTRLSAQREQRAEAIAKGEEPKS